MQIRYIGPHTEDASKARRSTGAANPAGTAGVDKAESSTGTTGTTAAKSSAGSKGAGVMDRIRATRAIGTAMAAAGLGVPGAAGLMSPTGTTSAMGATGPIGPAGATGPAGTMGPTGATGATGPAGAMGPAGTAGPKGSTGATGPKGATGARGADGGSFIIPFASGAPVTMTTIAGGLIGIPACIAFGSSAQGVVPLGSFIDLSVLPNMAFCVPRDGTIASMAAFFSTTNSLVLTGTTVSVMAQLYEASSAGNVFTPLWGANVQLSPSFTGEIEAGTVSSGLRSGLSVPVTGGTRILMVFTITAAGATLLNTVTGYASAGITIA